MTQDEIRAIALSIASELDPTANKGCGKSYILSADDVTALCVRVLTSLQEKVLPVARVIYPPAHQDGVGVEWMNGSKTRAPVGSYLYPKIGD